MSQSHPLSADIFCKVVDNFGDIGVCWRLAKQLSLDYGVKVRLFVDLPHIAQKLIPQLSLNASYPQQIDNISIYQWQAPMPPLKLSDIVIEAFACDMPIEYLSTWQQGRSTWINLEYLSCESWVEDMHLLPSPHPQLPLTKVFFMPGFRPKTGGLLREKKLISQRDLFLSNAEKQTAFWQSLKIVPTESAIRVSVFCYEHAPILALIEAFADCEVLIDLFITDCPAVTVLQACPQFKPLRHGSPVKYATLTIHALPFLTQEDYDCLLWSCDMNFVRGEDSWVRALWAAQLLVWQPYPQDIETTQTKQKAFIDHYTRGEHHPALLAWQTIQESFLLGQIEKKTLKTLLGHLSYLKNHAEYYCNNLLQQQDLTDQLIEYHLKNQQ